jgi:hypothetical protein
VGLCGGETLTSASLYSVSIVTFCTSGICTQLEIDQTPVKPVGAILEISQHKQPGRQPMPWSPACLPVCARSCTHDLRAQLMVAAVLPLLWHTPCCWSPTLMNHAAVIAPGQLCGWHAPARQPSQHSAKGREAQSPVLLP